MFQQLTQNLSKIFDRLKGKSVLSAEHVDLAMRELRVALLEADVALPVVKELVNLVSAKAVGQDVLKSLRPSQVVIKIIHDEIITILSSPDHQTSLQLKLQIPANLLLVGLQGSGKTTASAKLALRLKNQNKKVLLVSLDIYRPAAQQQLAKLALSAEIDCLPIVDGETPILIAQRAMMQSKLSAYEVVIYDTAGRLHVDDQMIAEVVKIKDLLKPAETLLVVDSLTGQDAVIVASNFEQKLQITGVILSRTDGDAKGGAALSIKYVINKPIKFLSSGEKLASLEEFSPARIASRILDMGDVVALVEKAASLADQAQSAKAAARLKQGVFDLNDYLLQINSVKKLGGLASVMSLLPGASKLIDKVNQSKFNEKILSQQAAMISSMTKAERRNPQLFNAARRKRIASGSGTSIQQVNILLKQFQQVADLMKKAGKMDAKSLMRTGIGKFFS